MNKNIVITGCSSGIGACLAIGLKARGYRVIASCRVQQDVDRLKYEGLETIHLDLADSASAEKRLEQKEKPRFTLPPEAILKSVVHAFVSRRARVRYLITTPSKIMSVLKRILPDRMMDVFLEVNSDQNK